MTLFQESEKESMETNDVMPEGCESAKQFYSNNQAKNSFVKELFSLLVCVKQAARFPPLLKSVRKGIEEKTSQDCEKLP